VEKREKRGQIYFQKKGKMGQEKGDDRKKGTDLFSKEKGKKGTDLFSVFSV
jgi:hypothetical protein